jgi:hypothetical protein
VFFKSALIYCNSQDLFWEIPSMYLFFCIEITYSFKVIKGFHNLWILCSWNVPITIEELLYIPSFLQFLFDEEFQENYHNLLVKPIWTLASTLSLLLNDCGLACVLIHEVKLVVFYKSFNNLQLGKTEYTYLSLSTYDVFFMKYHSSLIRKFKFFHYSLKKNHWQEN